MDELAELIDELVSKAGPTAGQIKLNQDPAKVARLKALGWNPPKKEPTTETIQKTLDASVLSQEQIKERLEMLEGTQAKILQTLAEHQKRIDECSIRR